MKKMTVHHVTVINRTIVFLEPLIKRANDEKLTSRIQADIDRLKEIKSFLIDSIWQPMLPFGMNQDSNTAASGP